MHVYRVNLEVRAWEIESDITIRTLATVWCGRFSGFQFIQIPISQKVFSNDLQFTNVTKTIYLLWQFNLRFQFTVNENKISIYVLWKTIFQFTCYENNIQLHLRKAVSLIQFTFESSTDFQFTFDEIEISIYRRG